MKFVIKYESDECHIVEAEHKHKAIEKVVNDKGWSMHDFYYGLDDGQIAIYEVTKEIS